MHGREPMSKVDTAWLRMESPTNLMMITGVLVLEKRLSVERLKQTVSARFLKYRRFNQRVIDLGAQAFWEVDVNFAIERHVHRMALPGAADKAELERCVSELASTALDHQRPLWEFHLIEDYAGGSALVVRIHHCYADGIALVQVMLSLTDSDPKFRDEAPAPALEVDSGGGFFERMFAPTRKGMDQFSDLIDGVLKKAAEFSQHPQAASEALAAKAQNGLREVGAFARELGAALSLSDDPQTALKGRLGTEKCVAWCAPLPLDEVKLVGRVFGATVNDVLLACASGVLRAHLLERGEALDGLQIRASVPVNLRSPQQATTLGNHFGLVFLELPVGEANPLSRLIAVRQAMRELKDSRQAMITFGLLNALGVGPSSVQKPTFELLSRKASVVATNVPGPVDPLFLAGAPITEMMFWVPQTGSIGVGLSILSYAGNVYFGLIADTQLIAEPILLTRAFAGELDKLVLLALMTDDQDGFTPAQADAGLRHFSTVRPSKPSMKGTVQPKSPKVGSNSTCAPKRTRSRGRPVVR